MKKLIFLLIITSFCLTGWAAEQPALDVVLLIDSTAGMEDELEQLRADLIRLTDSITQGQPQPEVRFGIVTYRDQGDDYVTQQFDFTAKPDALEKNLKAISAAGGGDTMEDVSEGLRVALQEMSWRDNVPAVIFLLGDAGPNDARYQMYWQAASVQPTIHALAAKGISPEGAAAFRTMAEMSGGTFQHVTYCQEAVTPSDTEVFLVSQGEESIAMRQNDIWQEGLAAVKNSGLDYQNAPQPGSGYYGSGFELTGNVRVYNNGVPLMVTRLKQHLREQGVTYPAPYADGKSVNVGQTFSDSYGGVFEQRQVVIKSEDAWQSLWQEIFHTREPMPDVPAIDFSANMVIGVFMGERRTGGYSIDITAVRDTEQRRYVLYEETAPAPNSMVTMAFTHPYHIVVVPQTDLPVQFVKIDSDVFTKAPANSKPIPETGENVDIQREFSGTYSGVTEAQNVAIRDKAAWQQLWNQVHSIRMPKPELPAVNFDEQMVIGVFQGQQRTGGFDIEIVDMYDAPAQRVVKVRELKPDAGGMVTMALTQPYHLVIVPTTDKPVTFQVVDQ